MRIKITSYQDGQDLAEKNQETFKECHIERVGNQWYLVVDKVGKKKKAAAW